MKSKKSTVTALVALGFLGSLFFLSLATPDFITMWYMPGS